MRRRRRAAQATAAVSSVAMLVGLVVSVPAGSPAAAATGQLPDPAHAVADPLGHGATVVSRTATSTDYLNPDGTHTMAISAGQVNFRSPSGDWQPADPSLQRGPKGRLVERAGAGGVDAAEISDSSSDLLGLSGSGWSAQVGLAGGTAGVPGVVRGASVEYDSLTPGVSVQLALGTSTAEALLIVQQPGASSWDLNVSATGSTLQAQPDGTVALVSHGQVVATVSGGIAQDSAPSPANTPVTLSLVSQTDLRVSIDGGWLLDSSRVFPVSVDPTVELGPPASGEYDAYAQQNTPTTNYNGASQYNSSLGAYVDVAGYTTYTSVQEYAFQHFDISPLAGKLVLGAQWKDWVYAESAANAPFTIWPTGGSWTASSITWNTLPGHYSTPRINTSAPTSGNWVYVGCSSACYGSGDAMTGLVTGWVNGSRANYGLDLDTAGGNSYVKLGAVENGGVNFTPTIFVTYVSYPNTPSGPSTNPATTCTTGSGRPYINTVTPTLSAVVSTPDGGNLQGSFEIWHTNGAEIGGQNLSASVGSGSTASWTVGSGNFVDGSTYSWRARDWNGYVYSSSYSPWCEFTIDTDPPPAPTLTSSTDPNPGTWYSSPSFTASWSAPSDVSGIAGYSVVLDHSASTVPGTTVTQTATGYTNNAMTSGVWYLHVRPKDNAGNWGSTATFNVDIETTTPTFSSPADSTAPPPGTTETLTALSDPSATSATFEMYYSGSWHTLATTTTPGNGTWTTSWNTASMTNGAYNYGDGPYLLAVQVHYPTFDGGLTSGPVVWVENHGPTLANETTGGGNPSEPNVVPPTTAGLDPAAGATVDDSKGALDLAATDTNTVDPSSLPLALTRSYSSSQAPVLGPFGMGWTDNYNLSVAADSAYSSSGEPVEDVIQENGSVVRFARDGHWNYAAPSQVNATLTCSQTDSSSHNCTGNWTFTRNGQNTYVFTNAGVLQSVTDMAGFTTTFAYTGSQLTTITAYTVANYASVSNPSYRAITLTWGACGSHQCVTTLTDPASRTVTYSYNGSSQLTSVKDVAGNFTNYGYSTAGQITSVQDPGGATSQFGYNAANQVVCEQIGTTACNTQQPQPPSWSYTLDTHASGTVTVTDPSGSQTTETLNDSQLTTAVQPQNASTAAYDPTAGGPSQVTTGCPPSDPTCANSTGEQSTVTYNTAGQDPGASIDDVILKRDALGNTTQVAYDANNQVWCQVDAADYANGTRCPVSQPTTVPAWNVADPYPGVSINYYTGKLLTAAKDPLGNITIYSYTAATDAPGANLQYCSVDPVDYKNQVTCPAYGATHVTGTTTETFDSAGRKLTETDADGNTTSYVYNAPGLPDKVSSMTDPDGNTTSYTYNALGDPTQTTVTFGSYTATSLDAYDGNGRKYCEVAPNQAAQGVTCPATPPANPPTPGSDPYPGATITTYDSDGRVTQTTNPIGGITLTAYDSNGNAYCSVEPQQAAAGVTCPSTPPSTPPTPGNDPYLGATINTYDSQSRLVQVTNPLGGITHNDTFDLNNNIIQTTVESNSASAPNVVTYNSYDADNRLVSKTVGYGSTQPETSINDYDPNGNTFCTVSANAYASGSYQCPVWQASWITQPPAPTNLYSNQPNTSQANDVTTSFYDADGHQRQTTNPDVDTTISAFDADGRTYCTSNATNVGSWLAANPTGVYPYICPASPPSIPAANGYTVTIFDAAGRTLSSTDAASDTTRYTYTPSGQKLTTQDPRGYTTTDCYYFQNGAGQCALAAPAGGGAANDLYSTTTPATAADPGGQVTTYTYFPGDQAKSTSSPAGTTTNAYDANGDLALVAYSNTATGYAAPVNVSYTYNPDGTRKTVSDATGTTTIGYDSNGDVTSQVLVATGGLANKTLGYGYYTTAQPASTTYPTYGTYTNPTVNYAYDPTGTMTSETDWLGNQVTFGHDPDGNVTGQSNNVSTANPNGTSSTTFGYDAADRNTQTVSTLAQTCGGNETLTQSFSGTGGSRNPDGQLTQDTDTYSASCSGQTNYQRNYTYDIAGRLVFQGASPQGAASNNFAYDPSGDLLTVSSRDQQGNFDTYTQTFDNAGETTGQNPVSAGVATSYTFDSLGDQSQAVTGTATSTYSYDQLGQMTAAVTPASTAAYLHNADGLTVATTTGGVTSQLLWNTNGSLPLILSDGTNHYIYGPGIQPVEQISLATSTPTYLTYSTSDASWLATNQTGNQLGYSRYDAYGTLATGTPVSPFGYSGQYVDATTGLVNDRARWFQPTVAAFTTRDPLFGQTDAAYAYASGDPVNQSDPHGLASIYYQGVANWAQAHAYDGNNNGYGDDCTDFASRALYFGGHDPQYDGLPWWSAATPEAWDYSARTNNHYWFRDSFHEFWWAPPIVISSYSWGGAWNLANHLQLNGSRFFQAWSQVHPGDLIFANLYGLNFSGIDHTGVIIGSYAGDPIIAQHSRGIIEALTTWYHLNPHMNSWFVHPNPS